LRRALIAVALAAVGVLCAGAGSASAATYVVRVTDANLAPGGHWFRADTRPPGTGTFVDGPATPPRGRGSFELNTPLGPVASPGAAKVQLLTDLFDRLPLRYIDGIGYSTYKHVTAGFPQGVNAINIRTDLDGNGTADAYLVYEPYEDPGSGQVVLPNVWQNWDAHRAGTAQWWISGNATCTQAVPCPWAAIVTLYPNATIREGASCGPGSAPKTPCPGSFGVNQGSGNPDVKSNADALYLEGFGQKLVFDFEQRGGRGGGGGRDDD
jgi:hypothetical protein